MLLSFALITMICLDYSFNIGKCTSTMWHTVVTKLKAVPGKPCGALNLFIGLTSEGTLWHLCNGKTHAALQGKKQTMIGRALWPAGRIVRGFCCLQLDRSETLGWKLWAKLRAGSQKEGSSNWLWCCFGSPNKDIQKLVVSFANFPVPVRLAQPHSGGLGLLDTVTAPLLFVQHSSLRFLRKPESAEKRFKFTWTLVDNILCTPPLISDLFLGSVQLKLISQHCCKTINTLLARPWS